MTEERIVQQFTVRGKNYEDCRTQIYNRHGQNYRIVEKGQKLETKLFGLMRKEYYEVRYSLQPETARQQTPDDFEKAQKNILKSLSAATSNKQMADINSKLEELSVIKSQLETITKANSGKHESIQKIEELLAKNEFTFQYISEITDRIRKEFSLTDLDDFGVVQRKVVDWIGESITVAKPKVFRPPHVIVLVGPTGVGKTTTIAKFAAMQLREDRNGGKPMTRCCAITIDTMRVGALAQISSLFSIMNTEVQKAENADDMEKIYEQIKDEVDTIYIDTAGYSPNDSFNIGKMKAILQVPGLDPDVYLVMSASTKAADLENIMRNYEPFDYRSVIVTKCDETDRYGNIISVLHKNNKPVSFICDGQHAARNLERASVVKNFLIRLQDFDIDRAHIEEIFGEQ